MYTIKGLHITIHLNWSLSIAHCCHSFLLEYPPQMAKPVVYPLPLLNNMVDMHIFCWRFERVLQKVSAKPFEKDITVALSGAVLSWFCQDSRSYFICQTAITFLIQFSFGVQYSFGISFPSGNHLEQWLPYRKHILWGTNHNAFKKCILQPSIFLLLYYSIHQSFLIF